MTRKEKKKLLVKFIELNVMFGHDIAPYVGVSVDQFDYDKIKEGIAEFKKWQ